MASPDWRSGEGFEWTRDCGLTALAWEFLRYNPDYRAFVRSGGREGDAPPELDQWGLRFRGGPGSRLARSPGLLASQLGSRCGVLLRMPRAVRNGDPGHRTREARSALAAGC